MRDISHLVLLETQLLATIFKNPTTFINCYSEIRPTYFTTNLQREQVYRTCVDIFEDGGTPDVATILAKTKNKLTKTVIGQIEKTTAPDIKNQPTIIKQLQNELTLYRLSEFSDLLTQEVNNEEADAKELLQKAETSFLKVDIRNETSRLSTTKELGKLAHEEIEKRKAGEEIKGILTGLKGIDNVTLGFKPGEFIIFFGRPSHGKAQDLDSKILLEDGTWTTMGNVKVGDRIASIDGKKSVVTNIFPQGQKDIYEIEFSDKRTVRACADHLWETTFKNWGIHKKTLTTKKIQSMLNKKCFKKRIHIETPTGSFGESKDLKIDPYILGVLLGDGNLTNTTPNFATTDKEIVKKVNKKSKNNIAITEYKHKNRTPTYFLTQKPINRTYPLINALKKYKLYGKLSIDKHIPQEYIKADRNDRLELIRGLMDTDGWVEKDSQVCFASSSSELAYGVQTLIRSVGGHCYITTKKTTHKLLIQSA